MDWLQQGWWNASLYIFCLQTLTWGCTQEFYSPNHMFRINKQLLNPTNMHMTWQNIPCHVMEYSPHHLKFSTWKMNITRIFHDMAYNIFEDFVLFKWPGSLAHLLTSLEILCGHMVVETMGVLALFLSFSNYVTTTCVHNMLALMLDLRVKRLKCVMLIFLAMTKQNF